MPPLFSSLAAALLSPPPRRDRRPSRDFFTLSLSDLHLQLSPPEPSESSKPPEPPEAPAPRPASLQNASPQPPSQQPLFPQPPSPPPPPHNPTLAMALAYSLLLIAHVPPLTTPLFPPLTTAAHPTDPTGSADRERRQMPPRRPYVDLAQASDLRARPRHIAIVTTAAMPWMTGTSVNPVLRALYLAHDGHRVTLVVPWLQTAAEQRRLFPRGSPTFATQAAQRRFIQRWACAQMPDATLDVLFYEAVYAAEFGSILPVGAITDVFAPPDLIKDVCILEEPEHLTWHHSGKLWTELFNIVIGVIHTNYLEYVKAYGFFGPQRAAAMLFLNIWVCRGYCHRIIKLSDAVQQFPNSITCNVHGVREKFISIGRNLSSPFPRGAYFMGKVLWAKGYRELVDNMVDYYNLTNEPLPIDFFGAGPDVSEVQEVVANEPALSAVKFDARVADHTGELLRGYKLFVNASSSDVVCTATAEALAMGKLVVCLDHPSNEFFATFPNCTTYRTPSEFATAVKTALQQQPLPLSDLDAYRLTWEAATERLYDAVRLPLSQRYPCKVGYALANVHATISKIYPQPGKGIRKAMSREVLSDVSGEEI